MAGWKFPSCLSDNMRNIMLLFTYRCEKCEKEFETWANYTDKEVPCPSCQNIAVKQITAPATIKGGPTPRYHR